MCLPTSRAIIDQPSPYPFSPVLRWNNSHCFSAAQKYGNRSQCTNFLRKKSHILNQNLMDFHQQSTFLFIISEGKCYMTRLEDIWKKVDVTARYESFLMGLELLDITILLWDLNNKACPGGGEIKGAFGYACHLETILKKVCQPSLQKKLRRVIHKNNQAKATTITYNTGNRECLLNVISSDISTFFFYHPR